VRVIEAFVDELDVATLGFERTVAASAQPVTVALFNRYHFFHDCIPG
jgi:hypothetical protein